MKPNFVILFSDQQRWDSLGCNGNEFVSTPNLDKMAQEGANFKNSFTCWPVCTPVRATMWTGFYPHRHRVRYNVYNVDNVMRELSREKETLFDILKDNNYTTAYFGKWHLGDEDPGMFDVWDGFNSVGGHWMDGKLHGDYKPDVQTDRMIEFMKSQQNSGKPFIAVNGYYPPHTPYTAPKKHMEMYRGRGIPHPGYYAAVSALDDNVGRTIAALDELGILDNTVVIYLSDHGDTFNYREDASNKFVCHDESIRVPFLVRFPKTVPAGTHVTQMIGLQDLMPSILEWADVEPPKNLHGKSFVPILEGKEIPWRNAFYVQTITRYNYIEQRCIRTDKWKLILSRYPHIVNDYQATNELYDLENDPEEELNVYDTPREDKHNQFGHFPPYTNIIETLATELKIYALEIDDDFGIELAEHALLEMAKRGETRTTQKAIAPV